MAAASNPASGAGFDPSIPPDAIEVGRVVAAWGLEGGIKVRPLAADPQALFSSKRWFLDLPARPGVPAALLRIVRARKQGDAIVAHAQELSDRTAAEAIQGARVFVSRASFPTPAADEYYWVDLIGMAVVDRRGEPLGTVDALIQTGPHCVLSIHGADPKAPPVLIPFVGAYVDRVDTAARRIEVDWALDF